MNFTITKLSIPSPGGALKLLVLRPTEAAMSSNRPGVLCGYITGMAEMVYHSRARGLVERFGAVVVTPEYRLAGEAPYPAALLDCHAAILYLKEHAAELGVRDDQLMVGGESAGGGLAAALCMYEKDIGGVSIAYQMPLYPMIDNGDTETSRDNHAPVWNTSRNHYGWKRYLRSRRGRRGIGRRLFGAVPRVRHADALPQGQPSGGGSLRRALRLRNVTLFRTANKIRKSTSAKLK